MTLTQRLIVWLYGRLDDWAKWEVYDQIKRPSIDAVLAEQGRQAKKLFGDNARRGSDA